MTDIQTDSDSDSEEVTLLKERFTMADFLMCPGTRQILEEERHQKFGDTLYHDIEEFYEAVCRDCGGGVASALYYDQEGTRFCTDLIWLVYQYLVPKYDLQIFYDHPNLAKPLSEGYEELLKQKEAERLKKQREAYQEANAHQGMKFNWASRAYKK
jgi:hypothetical protein